MEIMVNIPEDVAKLIGSNNVDIERQILRATALEEYRAGKLSHGQIGRMLGLTRFQVDAFLKEHNVVLNYTLNDLEEDRRTLDKLVLK